MDEGITSQSTKSYSQIFDECFSFYLSIGMTPAEYWEGDNDLPKEFRKAYKLRQENENYKAWLNGLYFYDAFMSAMSHLNKNQSDYKSYAERPYDFTPRKEEEKVIEAQAQAEVWLKSWVSATQKMFKKE